MPTGVYPRTEEWKKKLSLRFKGRPATEEARTPEARAKISASQMGRVAWNKGLTKETDIRVASTSAKLTGVSLSENHKKAVSNTLRGRKPSLRVIAMWQGRIPWNKNLTKDTNFTLANVSRLLRGHKVSKETRQKMSVNLRKAIHAMSEEQKAKWLKAHIAPASKHPNKAEGALAKLLNSLLPEQYVYTGDGQVIINGLCPDFVNKNGQKKIIEMFGNYWHTKRVRKWQDTELGRQMAYSYYGFDCLVVWESELVRENREALMGKILEFHNKDRTHCLKRVKS